jgi:hypothetical protein
VHYTTSCNTQSSAPEDGQNNFPKHVDLSGIINKLLLLHLVGCLYYLYQWCTVKKISDNSIYLLIKCIKSVLWRIAKRLSYIEDAWCLKVNMSFPVYEFWSLVWSSCQSLCLPARLKFHNLQKATAVFHELFWSYLRIHFFWTTT